MRKRIVVSLLLAMTLLITACGSAKPVVTYTFDEETSVSDEPEASVPETEEENTLAADDTATPEEATEETPEEPGEDTAISGRTEEVEDGMPDLSQLIYPTQKDDYALAIYEAITALPEEKPESSLKQKDVDCDTLQWMNATYAMFTYSCHWDYEFVGGVSDKDDSQKDYIKDQLDSSWGITDRQTMIDTLCWLVAQGQAPDFAEQAQALDWMGLLQGSDEEIKEAFVLLAVELNYDEETTAYLQDFYINVRDVYAICGDNGIDAWDYCRITQLCGACYYVGYITLEESLAIQLEVARAIQQEFSSWVEMNDSYYYGYAFWQSSDYAVSLRKMAYDTLMEKEDSPFNVLDFDMPLEKFW